MQVTAITPIRISDEELERRRERYRKLSPPGVELELVNLADGDGVPRTLDSAADIEVSDRLVAEAARSHGARADAVLPDCVLDPAIDSLEAEGGPPAFGILRLAAGFLASCGRRFGAVTRNRAIADELERRLGVYGLEPWFEGVQVLELDFDAISDARWERALEGAQAAFSGTRAQAIINGCSAVELHGEHATPVVDPTALAMRLVGVAGETV
jgi:Asp/Glu/hydantoin racemase